MNRYALRRTGVSITAAVVCALGIGAAGPGVAQADQPAHTRAVETHAVQRQPAHRANAGWYTVQGTDSQLTAGQDIAIKFAPVTTQYVMIVFTTLPYEPAVPSTNTPAGYRDGLIDVRVYGA